MSFDAGMERLRLELYVRRVVHFLARKRAEVKRRIPNHVSCCFLGISPLAPRSGTTSLSPFQLLDLRASHATSTLRAISCASKLVQLCLPVLVSHAHSRMTWVTWMAPSRVPLCYAERLEWTARKRTGLGGTLLETRRLVSLL